MPRRIRPDIAAVALGCLALAACAAPAEPPMRTPQTDALAEAAALLAAAAARNAAALDALLAAERARTPPSPPQRAPHLPIDLVWRGPARDALARIAETLGWRFVETGTPPPVPPGIAIRAAGRPASALLADIALALRREAEVIAKPDEATLELRHLGPAPAAASRPGLVEFR